jgi:Uma2 family endonuclease
LGAPDLIIEILSPGNSKKEMQDKFSLYQESGVREYWIVYTGEESISQFLLNENEKYELVKMYANDDLITPAIFSALTIDLKDVFY